MFAYRNLAPVRSILRLLDLDRSPSALGAYESIRASISGLLVTNQNLRRRVAQQRLNMRDLFVRRLLSGSQVPDEWFEATASSVGIPTDDGRYVVVGLRIEGYGYSATGSMPDALRELDVARATVEQSVTAVTGRCYFHHITPELTAAILVVPPAVTSYQIEVERTVVEARRAAAVSNVVFSVGVGRRGARLDRVA